MRRLILITNNKTCVSSVTSYVDYQWYNMHALRRILVISNKQHTCITSYIDYQ